MHESPIQFVDRQRGQSKIDRHEAIGALRPQDLLCRPDLAGVDPADFKFLIQGVTDARKAGLPYGQISWQLGLLTPKRP